HHRFRVAAFAAQKRDYVESFSPCQQVCERFAFKLTDFGARLFPWRPSLRNEEANNRRYPQVWQEHLQII
ncbi:hypothetical protein, partial [uncultured Caballeronia sp.]|uniref:hypothetical protein n=1 Tax=uncultured Caballeronia sp. TaxID=1827198 RepID=UPI0035CB3FDA